MGRFRDGEIRRWGDSEMAIKYSIIIEKWYNILFSGMVYIPYPYRLSTENHS